MTDPEVGALIVRHIDELEAAIRYSNQSMKPALGRAVAEIIEHKRKALGWTGEIPKDLDQQMWLAPAEWRAAIKQEDFDLFCEFVDIPCMDHEGAETWVGAFCGFAGARVGFAFASNALGTRPWKALLRSESSAVEELIANGFVCDARTGELAIYVQIERDALAQAFAEQNFDDALAPIGSTLDRIRSVRPALDRLVERIREVVQSG